VGDDLLRLGANRLSPKTIVAGAQEIVSQREKIVSLPEEIVSEAKRAVAASGKGSNYFCTLVVFWPSAKDSMVEYSPLYI